MLQLAFNWSKHDNKLSFIGEPLFNSITADYNILFNGSVTTNSCLIQNILNNKYNPSFIVSNHVKFCYLFHITSLMN